MENLVCGVERKYPAEGVPENYDATKESSEYSLCPV